MTILDKFTHHFSNVLKRSHTIAKSHSAEKIELTHLLVALYQEKGSTAAEILHKSTSIAKSKTDQPLLPDPITAVFMQSISLKSKKPLDEAALLPDPTVLSPDTEPNDTNDSPLALSEATIKAIEKSVLTAARHKHKYVGTEHLLASIVDLSGAKLNSLFSGVIFNVAELKQDVKTILTATSKVPDLIDALDLAPGEETADTKEHETAQKKPHQKEKIETLSYFGKNLTSAQLQSSIDPVIGREKEITRIIQILGRRTKNNPVLIGEPGVGKTAIVEGLAKKILEGTIPDALLKKKIYALDMPLLVAGTMYRGEFELRLKQVLEEVRNTTDIILFIDEIHTIIGTGGSGNSAMDAANILKPMLARGELRCIGTTTLQEYKKYIEADPALERRFQPVLIPELSPEETEKVIAGIKIAYETYHHVTISPEAITTATQLSKRYLTEKRLPDKAIDLIDEAASRKKLHVSPDERTRMIHQLESDIESIAERKKEAVKNEHYSDALTLKHQEEQLRQKLEVIVASVEKTNDTGFPVLTKEDIVALVSEITGVPLGEIGATETQSLQTIEEKLGKEIFGQNEALSEISGYLKRARTGLSGAHRPLGSFLFIGPTGVGKTETAAVLARSVFGSESSLIRIDMSELGESFSISRLIGAPPGYIGFREGGRLTEAVRRKPYSVVLFDEIEKAHPDVFHILLQILDNGKLTDAEGKAVDFKNTIIILTSNIGMELLNETAEIGFAAETNQRTPEQFNALFAETKDAITKELHMAFRPEFLNRLDSTIFFQPLTHEAVRRIAEQELARIRATLAENKILFSWNPSVLTVLTRDFDPRQGGRGIRRAVQNLIENRIADILIEHANKPNISISAKAKAKSILFDVC